MLKCYGPSSYAAGHPIQLLPASTAKDPLKEIAHQSPGTIFKQRSVMLAKEEITLSTVDRHLARGLVPLEPIKTMLGPMENFLTQVIRSDHTSDQKRMTEDHGKRNPTIGQIPNVGSTPEG